MRKTKSKKKTKAQEFEYIMEMYRQAHPEEDGGPIIPDTISKWAIARGIAKREPVAAADVLRRELARHLKSLHMKDPQGRVVRSNHAVVREVMTPEGPVRRSEWYPLFEAPPAHIRVSFGSRRQMIVHDARQLELDLESYNDNNVYKAKVDRISFDIDADLAELKMPTDYKPPKSEDDDEDDDPPVH